MMTFSFEQDDITQICHARGLQTLSLGPVAPFDAAAVVMLAGGVVVAFSWSENYGDSSDRRSFGEQLRNGAHAIYSSACPLTIRGCWGCHWAHAGMPAQCTLQFALQCLKA